MTAKQRKEAEAIERIKRGLHCTDEEAKEIYATDKAIDNGAIPSFDLTPEQEAVARQMTRTGTREVKKPLVLNLQKPKERKPDEVKMAIIQHLADSIAGFAGIGNIEVTNAAKQIDFTLDGESYYIALTRKRGKKGR